MYPEDTGENFLFHTDGDYSRLYFKEEGEYTISLKLLPKETLHKIDNKYLDIEDAPIIKNLLVTVEELQSKIKSLEDSQATVVTDYNQASDLIGGAE
jgi:hypothetical protein